MKRILFIILSLATLVLVGCEEKGNIPSPGSNDYNRPSPGLQGYITMDDTTGFVIPSDTISTRTATAICKGLASGKTTTETYKIIGVVQSLVDKYTTAETASFYLVNLDHIYSDRTDDQFYCFKIKNIGGTTYESAGYGLPAGTVVIVEAKLTNYNGTYETAQNTGVLLASTYKEPVVETQGDGTFENPYTIADVIALRSKTEGEAYVRGYIVGAVADEASDFVNDNIELAAPFTKASNIVLADNSDETDASAMAPVKLPKSLDKNYKHLYSKLNVKNNESNIGKEVIIYGSLEKLFNTNGINSITAAWLDGEEITK